MIETEADTQTQVREIVQATPILDIHTHLYPPHFRKLSLWGIDELVNYHYLVAELFRSTKLEYTRFWAMSKREQADLIWETLFVRNTPISEATRGVVAVMRAFGLDPTRPTLRDAREFFRSQDPERHIRLVLEIAGVSEVVMTNDVFDEQEAAYWNEQAAPHPRFHAVLRMDPLLNNWDQARATLDARGYATHPDISGESVKQVRRFLDDWIGRMDPLYMAVSLPPDFAYPDESPRSKMLDGVILPACREHDIPLAMMIGVRKGVNPDLRDAGDSVGHADIRAVENICRENHANRFLVTMLSRENQHELCVAGRKFCNLMPFGCWWFMNNPSIVAEITNERIEMLGTSFIPQHSDARILEQLIYKWAHSRRVIVESLAANYSALQRDGWTVTREQIQRDVQRLFQGNFRQWTGMDGKI